MDYLFEKCIKQKFQRFAGSSFTNGWWFLVFSLAVVSVNEIFWVSVDWSDKRISLKKSPLSVETCHGDFSQFFVFYIFSLHYFFKILFFFLNVVLLSLLSNYTKKSII